MDYYLCSTGDETVMVAAYGWDGDALQEYDEVRELPYWQAVQLTVALLEFERSPVRAGDLFPLAAFIDADEHRIAELLAGDTFR
jgi:hypothetical protein